MPVHLYVAPAGGGKTSYLVARARAMAADLTPASAAAVRVVVPTHLQVRAWKRRLAEAGGALGVQVGTFDALYRQVLREAGQVYTRLSDPVQYRLLRLLAAEGNLVHYRPLRAAPGLIRVVLDRIGELKAGGVFEDQLTRAIEQMGNEPRLRELADLYTAYQERLRVEDWADAAGAGWLAQEALRDRPDVAGDWPCVMVDGFDDLTSVQLALLRELSQREGELLIALTGTIEGPPRRETHKRFNETRGRIEERLGIAAQPLPAWPGLDARAAPTRAPALAHLEATLYARETPGPAALARFEPTASRHRVGTAGLTGESVVLIAAPDREGEVRAALRWLKQRLIEDGVRPGEAALLARAMDAYRPYVQQIAAEYGIPVQMASGLTLRSNPAVAALMDLLRLAAPGGSSTETREMAYPWRRTVEAWRSPYFNLSETHAGAALQDAQALDRVARWGSVVGGLEQWRQAFALLEETLGQGQPEALDEEMPPALDILPTAEAAHALADRFERFVTRITPPEGDQSCSTFVRWIEELIGDETAPDSELQAGEQANSLGIARAAIAGPRQLAERDRAALIALKDVLRGLVWAEGALGCAPGSFAAFLDDLQGAINTMTYRLPMPADREAVLAAGVTQARGVSFRAVAVLGLAEGEFPTALVEDPFLRDADRRRLRDEYHLAVDLTAEGAEAAYFYEAVTRPREWLLLTRPRIADNGAPWQASPYWEEVLQRVAAEPVELTGSSQPALDEAASWPELLRAVGGRIAGGSGHWDALATATGAPSHNTVVAASHAANALAERDRLWAWAMAQDEERFVALQASANILKQRAAGEGQWAKGHRDAPATAVSMPYDGDLTPWGATFGRRFGPQHTWSASRLESYRTCPFSFYVGSVLGLEPRMTPTEGLDARQLGNLYHRIMEEVYRTAGPGADLEHLLARLPEVAGPIMDDAPRREGFRATAWWAQTQVEILENVRDSLRALDELRGEYVPHAYERAFGIPGAPGEALVAPAPAQDPVQGPGRGPDGEDTFRMRGLIDRVDRAPDGRVRIIDYKTGGPASFRMSAFAEGKKLQLPLYALAAREALGLGEIADGYYWHVRHAAWHLEKARSREWVSLAKMGVQEAIDRALAYVWETLYAVREGHFVPKPPDDGCPEYCPAAGFCWHYEKQGW